MGVDIRINGYLGSRRSLLPAVVSRKGPHQHGALKSGALLQGEPHFDRLDHICLSIGLWERRPKDWRVSNHSVARYSKDPRTSIRQDCASVANLAEGIENKGLPISRS